jgi:subtilase family serine protease
MTPPITNSSNATLTGSRFLQSTASNTLVDAPFYYVANPPTRLAVASEGPAAIPPPSVCVRAYGLACYTPKEIRSAYDVPAAFDGTGQTIVIVDAYGSPTIQHDLQVFDKQFGLPDPKFNIIYPTGQPVLDQSSASIRSWESETSLDVEWAHAIAPGATVDLLVAPTNQSTDLNAAEQYAVDNHLGNVMSLSFGAPEQSIPGKGNNKHLKHSDDVFAQAQEAKIAVFASAGDTGATNGLSSPVPLFPSSDPLVTAVGGTNLFISDAGAYQKETVWNDTDPSLCPFGCQDGAFGATGGAPSLIFAAPSYQRMLTHQKERTTADVGYDASVYTAVLVYESFAGPGFYFVGGTSSGSPQWAGIAALADQAAGQSLGFLNNRLYKIAKHGGYGSAFHDVTIGQNGLFGGPGFPAAQGYDIPTGLGTPDVTNLINALTHTDDSVE